MGPTLYLVNPYVCYQYEDNYFSSIGLGSVSIKKNHLGWLKGSQKPSNFRVKVEHKWSGYGWLEQ